MAIRWFLFKISIVTHTLPMYYVYQIIFKHFLRKGINQNAHKNNFLQYLTLFWQICSKVFRLDIRNETLHKLVCLGGHLV